MGFKMEEPKGGNRRYWPVFGFLMLVAVGIISFFLAPTAIQVARRIVPAFRGTELPQAQMQLIFTFVVFVIIAGIGAAIVAIAAPKSKMHVKEAELMKEREAILKEHVAHKERQRKINRQMRNQ